MTKHLFTKVARQATAGVVAVATAASLTACMSDDSGDDVIKIGSTEASESQWKVFAEEAKKAGLNIEVVPYTDYPPVNDAVVNGDLDANQFQHIQYLAEYNVKSDSDLKPFGATETFPMGIYAKNASTIDEIIEDGEVVIQNDSTNGGRAIKLLAAAGLITLRQDDLIAPMPADIDESKSKVKVRAISAEQTAVAYNEGSVAVINNNFLKNANVTADDAIYKDDPSDPTAQPYINVFVTRADDVDNEDYQKLVEIWRDDAVQAAVAEDTSGSAVQADISQEELEQVLEDTEQKFRDQGTSEDE
ncbi:MAG TPA: methionine ABC transporter substrate-binding protein [Candidatus Corynebacterium avicola]|uniref:Methionine ABC transporter substrate-binding protein n=1 Tax=Candidatus Corynebacterium avicola TaxID=2838527 RepID=A0A9D1RQI7_9CORY|nr:methionine ABC transporter substrate-binding protein [Candidatus Corynebacterium avicola]